jgi:hypothetical protein
MREMGDPGRVGRPTNSPSAGRALLRSSLLQRPVALEARLAMASDADRALQFVIPG